MRKKAPFSDEDLKNNLITGFTSGYYMYFRKIYNDLNLNRIESPSIQYKAANFYFIREYCYGSMFRYNKKTENLIFPMVECLIIIKISNQKLIVCLTIMSRAYLRIQIFIAMILKHF